MPRRPGTGSLALPVRTKHDSADSNRHPIWSVGTKYRVWYIILFVCCYTAGLVWAFVRWTGLDGFVQILSSLAIASAGVSFFGIELWEIVRVIYQAVQELRAKRKDRLIEEGRRQERERLRKAGVEIPPEADERTKGSEKSGNTD